MALGLAPAARADAATGPLRWIELPVRGQKGLAQRALALYPADAQPGQTYPGLLLFHGRGEARREVDAIHAWREPYGLEDSYARLSRPPIELSPKQRRFIETPQLDAINEMLARRPFSGLVVICPVTPNPRRSHRPELVLDRYSE